MKSLFIFSKRNQRKFFKIDTFGKFFQKSCESGVFDFCWSGPQLVQNIKPIRKLLCTFSSGSVLGIYLIYNIYKFQENQRTKKGSLFTFHFTFTSLTTSCAGGRQRKSRAAITQHGYSTARARLGHSTCKTSLGVDSENHERL